MVNPMRPWNSTFCEKKVRTFSSSTACRSSGALRQTDLTGQCGDKGNHVQKLDGLYHAFFSNSELLQCCGAHELQPQSGLKTVVIIKVQSYLQSCSSINNCNIVPFVCASFAHCI